MAIKMVHLLLLAIFFVIVTVILLYCVDLFPVGSPKAKQIVKIIIILLALVAFLERASLGVGL